MKQQIIQIKAADLLDRVHSLHDEGCRLVQICCTRVPEGFELSYTFDRAYNMYHLRLTVGETTPVMSITSLYWPAFIYENEMRDLFGVQIRHIADEVDYGGSFYRLAEKTPWRTLPPQHKTPPAPQKPAAKPAPPAAEKPAEAPETKPETKPEGGEKHG